ncbi:MAG: hypothetical protein Kow0080_01220 [Candidatus Promineifilaceae bacterium]
MSTLAGAQRCAPIFIDKRDGCQVEEAFPYHVFIVRCWLERDDETAVWRFTIQEGLEGDLHILNTVTDLSQTIEQKLGLWEKPKRTGDQQTFT